jgi:hypothetical protein
MNLARASGDVGCAVEQTSQTGRGVGADHELLEYSESSHPLTFDRNDLLNVHG